MVLIRSFRNLCQSREEKFCKRLGLTTSQFTCLAALPSETESVSISRISGLTQLSHSRSSRVVDSMVVAGLLTRCSLPSDRRTQVVTLTAKGEQTWRAVQGLLRECERDLRAQFTGEQAAQVIETLQLLVRHWQSHVVSSEPNTKKDSSRSNDGSLTDRSLAASAS